MDCGYVLCNRKISGDDEMGSVDTLGLVDRLELPDAKD